MGILIAIHVIVCVVLIGIILIQRGRGGGFVDSFQGLETVFGTKTSAFLTKATTVLATLFFITCLILAFLSLRQSRSLIRTAPVSQDVRNQTGQQIPSAPGAETPAPADQGQVQAPSQPVPSEGGNAADAVQPGQEGKDQGTDTQE